MQNLYMLSPRLHGMARTIITHELAQQPEPASLAVALETVYAKLRKRLGELVGLAGFTALFNRALHLTRREEPLMSGISINPDDPATLRGTDVSSLSGSATAGAFALLVANFIWLLEVFLDIELATRLIAEIWPQVAGAGAADGGTHA